MSHNLSFFVEEGSAGRAALGNAVGPGGHLPVEGIWRLRPASRQKGAAIHTDLHDVSRGMVETMDIGSRPSRQIKTGHIHIIGVGNALFNFQKSKVSAVPRSHQTKALYHS